MIPNHEPFDNVQKENPINQLWNLSHVLLTNNPNLTVNINIRVPSASYLHEESHPWYSVMFMS